MSGYGLRKIMERLTPPRSLYYRTFLPGGTPVRFSRPGLRALVAAGPLAAQGPRVEITVSPAVRNTPVAGRVYVFVSRRNDEEPRLQVHHESDCTPFFGVDVSALAPDAVAAIDAATQDRKSTRLNSSHVRISYAVFCLKKKKIMQDQDLACSNMV